MQKKDYLSCIKTFVGLILVALFFLIPMMFQKPSQNELRILQKALMSLAQYEQHYQKTCVMADYSIETFMKNKSSILELNLLETRIITNAIKNC